MTSSTTKSFESKLLEHEINQLTALDTYYTDSMIYYQTLHTHIDSIIVILTSITADNLASSITSLQTFRQLIQSWIESKPEFYSIHVTIPNEEKPPSSSRANSIQVSHTKPTKPFELIIHVDAHDSGTNEYTLRYYYEIYDLFTNSIETQDPVQTITTYTLNSGTNPLVISNISCTITFTVSISSLKVNDIIRISNRKQYCAYLPYSNNLLKEPTLYINNESIGFTESAINALTVDNFTTLKDSINTINLSFEQWILQLSHKQTNNKTNNTQLTTLQETYDS